MEDPFRKQRGAKWKPKIVPSSNYKETSTPNELMDNIGSRKWLEGGNIEVFSSEGINH